MTRVAALSLIVVVTSCGTPVGIQTYEGGEEATSWVPEDPPVPPAQDPPPEGCEDHGFGGGPVVTLNGEGLTGEYPHEIQYGDCVIENASVRGFRLVCAGPDLPWEAEVHFYRDTPHPLVSGLQVQAWSQVRDHEFFHTEGLAIYHDDIWLFGHDDSGNAPVEFNVGPPGLSKRATECERDTWCPLYWREWVVRQPDDQELVVPSGTTLDDALVGDDGVRMKLWLGGAYSDSSTFGEQSCTDVGPTSRHTGIRLSRLPDQEP